MPQKNLCYYVLITLVYLGLIYTTALHYVLGPEATINDSYFSYTGDHFLQKYFSDIGSIPDLPDMTNLDLWKLSNFWGDAGFYLIQTEGIKNSIAPYKFRFLPTAVVSFVKMITGWRTEKAFMALNIIACLATAIIFTRFLLRYFRFSKGLSFIGGILFITLIANTRTFLFRCLSLSRFSGRCLFSGLF